MKSLMAVFLGLAILATSQVAMAIQIDNSNCPTVASDTAVVDKSESVTPPQQAPTKKAVGTDLSGGGKTRKKK